MLSSTRLYAQSADTYSLMFYNLENLFDLEDDPTTNDDDYTRGEIRGWSYYRIKDKLNKISKVIISANAYELPDIVAVCEVENRELLEQLVEKTAIKGADYRIIHKDSPDARGIDVAILYRKERAKPIFYKYHPLIDSSGDTLRSREILEAHFVMAQDTVCLFANHWPSRYGGQTNTIHKRMLASSTLSQAIAKLRSQKPNAKIVCMGDFNDEPQNRSMKTLCKAGSELTNLSSYWKTDKGTLKHQSTWSIFDQVICSKSLIKATKGLHCQAEDAEIIEFDFLLQEDPKWGGSRLFRTHYGMKYQGGFSDHLPIILYLRQQ